jgi:hypothetical protein
LGHGQRCTVAQVDLPVYSDELYDAPVMVLSSPVAVVALLAGSKNPVMMKRVKEKVSCKMYDWLMRGVSPGTLFFCLNFLIGRTTTDDQQTKII